MQAAQGPFDVDVENPYSDITVKSAVLADGVLTIKVGYAAENQMAGIGYSYTLYDEDVTGRAIARQIDADGNVQADRANITGTVRDCTVYTMTVPEDAEDLKVTVDGLTTWTYDQESKTLTISGSGAMADFTYTTIDDKKDAVDEQGLMSFPWAQYKNEVQKVVVEDGITRLGIQSFRKFFALTELIVDSDDLTEIEYRINNSLQTVDVILKGEVQGDAICSTWHGLTVNSVTKQTKNDLWTYDVSVRGDKTCNITGYRGTDEDLVIPTEIDGYIVKAIGNSAFENNDTVKSVTFEEDSQCERIGTNAFKTDHPGVLESVTLPKTLKTIGDYAFYNRIKLTNVSDFPDGLESIGTGAFWNCNLTKDTLVIPASVTAIGGQAFRWDSNIQNIVVKSERISLGKEAFNLTTATNSSYYYVDLSAVKDLTVENENKATGDNNQYYTINLPKDSAIYVADDAAAAAIKNAAYGYDPTRVFIVCVNGGVTGEDPTGLVSITRADGDENFTAQWYTDADCTAKVEDIGTPTPGTTGTPTPASIRWNSPVISMLAPPLRSSPSVKTVLRSTSTL